jgi:PAS domain S-box-containing protein
LGKPFVAEYRLLAKSGRILWLRDEARMIFDQNGLPLFIQGLAQDITERKETEEALRETTQTLQTLIQASPLAIIVLDRDFTIRLWNPGAEQIFGWKESEVLGRRLPFIPEEQLPETNARLIRELAGEVHAALELRRLKKDGSPIDVQLWTAPLRDAQGDITGIIGIQADITERKQVEKALMASEANYRTIFNGVNDGIGVVDMATGNFLDVNRKWQEMSGYTAAEARGLSIAALCADLPDFSAADAFRFVKAATQGGPQIFEWLGTTKDGRIHWVEVNLKRAVINDQERLLTVVRDISARKRAEEELRRHAELLDLAHDAILVRDLNNRILFWNSGAEETYGWSKEEAQGRNAHELLETGFLIPVAELNAEFFRQGQWQGELAHTRRDGRRIMVTSRWALQRGKDGAPAAILEINRDITEQKQAEAGRARLAAILEATSDLVGTADLKGRVLYLNRAGRNLLGIGEAEDVSRLAVKDLQPEWAYRLLLEQAGAEVKSSLAWSGETAFLTRHGQEIPTSQVIVVHRDANGEAEFFSTIARDITASKRGEAALKKSEQDLRLLTNRILNLQEKEHRRVARELHDELGQALTVLKINLVAIEEKLAPEQESLKAGCEQMLSYIDTVIENVRRLSWDLSPSSLDDLGLSASLQYLVEDICRSNQMQSRVALDEIDQLFSPEIQINIYRIFQESLTNIVKHARASRVSVRVEKHDKHIYFLIKDNGCGFDLKGAISRKATQKNLGLTAMQERALMGGGSLQITSRRGQGTTIRFSLPIQRKLH